MLTLKMFPERSVDHVILREALMSLPTFVASEADTGERFHPKTTDVKPTVAKEEKSQEPHSPSSTRAYKCLYKISIIQMSSYFRRQRDDYEKGMITKVVFYEEIESLYSLASQTSR